MEIKISQVKNGYVVRVDGSLKGDDGVTVHRVNEELLLLEFIGKVILQKKVRVEER